MVVQIPYAIYLLGGVAVKVATSPAGKELAKRLIAQGFKKQAAYKTFEKFTTATKENLIGLITRAKNAVSKGKPTSNNKKGDGGSAMTTAGSRGQSELGRRLGLSKLRSRGKVGPKSASLPKKVPKKPLAVPKAPPKPVTTSKSTTTSIPKRLAQGLNIAAVAGIGKVAYDAYKEKEAAEKKLKEAERARSDLSTAKDKRSLARKVRAATKVDEAKKKLVLAEKKLEVQITKNENRPPPKSKPAPEIEKGAKPLDESSYKKGIKSVLFDANLPELRRVGDEAQKEALTFVLNKKIKDKKSTVSKEKAKARAGNYKTLAEAKKAGSLYYLHKDKGLRAAISYQDVKFKMREIQDKKRKDLGISRDDYENAFGKLTFKRK